MKDYQAKVVSIFPVAKNIYYLLLESRELASVSNPGQFCNIKVSDSNYPFLRRPFSIADSFDDKVAFLFKVVGEGTLLLSKKKEGDLLSVLGPLGNSFFYNDDFEVGIILAGGLGIAPFYFLRRKFIEMKKSYLIFIGAKDNEMLVKYEFNEAIFATDLGDFGIKGTALDAFGLYKEKLKDKKIKIFACGPNAMLQEIKKLSETLNVKAELSLEGPMACGFGICQGCAIKAADREGYYLICKDGPIFDSSKVII